MSQQPDFCIAVGKYTFTPSAALVAGTSYWRPMGVVKVLRATGHGFRTKTFPCECAVFADAATAREYALRIGSGIIYNQPDRLAGFGQLVEPDPE